MRNRGGGRWSIPLLLLLPLLVENYQTPFERSAVEAPPDAPGQTDGVHRGQHFYHAFFGRRPTAKTAFSRAAVEFGGGLPILNFGQDTAGPMVYNNDDVVVVENGDNEFVDTYANVEPKPLREAVEYVPERRITTYIRNEKVGGSFNAENSRVVCYWGAWSIYRPAPFAYGVGDLDAFGCTHLIYSFAGLHNETLKMVSLDPEVDVVQGNYKAFTGLKRRNPDLKVMIAIGGWNEGGKKYSEMASSKKSRRRFVKSALRFVRKHKFDGLDLDWEYPGATDRGGSYGDKANFVALVKDLRTAFDKYDLILSAAVSAAKFRVDEGYDVPKLAEKLDFINVMTYDLHGSWDNFADHHAPLYRREHDDWNFRDLNVDAAMQLWHEKGAPKNKLVMGVPFYGRSFTLADANAVAPGSRTSGPGQPGMYTDEEGFLAYYEICQLFAQGGWKAEMDDADNPYMHKEDQWIGFDGPENIARKAKYVRDNNFGGVMVWAIDLDDYNGICSVHLGRDANNEILPKSPLLNAINRVLRPTVAPILVEEQTEVLPSPGVDPDVVLVDTDTDTSVDTPVDFICPSSGVHASPVSCADFYLCSPDLVPTKYTCQNGLYFDSSIGNCNWPDSVDCKINDNQRNVDCNSLANGLYPDPNDCRAMFWCRGRHQPSVRMSCPLGHYFDPHRSLCSPYAAFRCLLGPYEGFASAHKMYNQNNNNVAWATPYSWSSMATWDDSRQVSRQISNGHQANPYLRGSRPGSRISDSHKLLCYFVNWSAQRPSRGKFVPEQVDARLCSHVVYAYASVDTAELELRPSAPKVDVEQGFYNRLQRTVRKSNGEAKILLAIGGWTESSGDTYSRLVNSAKARARFVKKAVKFVRKHDFDGISLEWQYPVCWQADCSKGPESDKMGYSALIEELSEALHERGLILSVAVAGFKSILDQGYDLRSIGENADLVSVLTYDYHGFWDGRTGHHSPLYRVKSDNYEMYNVDATLKYVNEMGVPKSKLVMGAPAYGQSFRLITSSNEYGAPVEGRGDPGPFTLQAGMLAYYEICSGVNDRGWTKVNGVREHGPYAYRRNQWVSYDDVDTIRAKAQYVVDKGLAGMALWTVDLDDFDNVCCLGANPLQNAASSILRGVEVSNNDANPCQKPEPVVTPKPIENDGENTTPWDDGGIVTDPTPIDDNVDNMDKEEDMEDMEDMEDNMEDDMDKEDIVEPGESCMEGKYYPHKQKCDHFYQCVSGKKQLRKCSPGLAWNKQANICDWEVNVDCDNNDNEMSEDKKEEKPDKRPTEAVESEECEEGKYESYANDCSMYTVCVGGERQQRKCAPGLHWSHKAKSCDWPELAECKNARVRSNVGAKCRGGSLEANPGDCGSYLECVFEELTLRPCAPGLHFNANSKQCEFPDTANCKVTAAPQVEPVVEEDDGDDEDDWLDHDDDDDDWLDEDDEDEEEDKEEVVRPPPVEIPLSGPLSGDFKVVCYFTNWAWYRPGVGKYSPDDIDPSICTHIVYGFAVLDYSTLQIKAHDGWADFDNDFYGKVTEFKKYGIKVTLALGGWNDSLGDKYSRLVRNREARRRFIEHAKEFIKKHDFDGLDLDWEYPGCWQTECKDNRAADKEAFTAWVHELKEAFRSDNLLLSAAVSPNSKIIDFGYEVPKIAQDLDWIAVMTYDYHGHWDKQTGHVAPMYEHPDTINPHFNADFTIRYWLEKGAPKNKIVMGMPLYGQAFTLADPSKHGLNAKAPQKGQAGEFTRAAGFLAYYEICHKIKTENWNVVQEPNHVMGPYAYKGNQWVGYDDVAMIQYKSEYIRKMGLAGGMVWALDLDDFNNRCGEGKHPLMNTIKKVLGPPINQYPGIVDGVGINRDQDIEMDKDMEADMEMDMDKDMDKEMDKDDIEDDIDVVEPEDDMEDKEEETMDNEYKVVCYFTNWAWYRPGSGKFTPEDIEESLCTHIVYGFAVLNPNTLLLTPHDAWADLDNEFYERVTSLKTRNRKVLIALGGWNDSAGNKYSRMVGSRENRRRFIERVVAFIKKYDFDGLDLDWEYPKCWQVNCDRGPDSDKKNFAMFVKELSMAFKPEGLMLTAAVSPSKMVIDAGYDVETMSKYMDYVSIMTYDYHGQWDKKTGHVAPMYHHDLNANEYFNVNFTVHYWLEKGLSPKKLILGLPLYGQSFTLADNSKNGLQSASYGGGEAGQFTRSRGFLSYYEICQNIKMHGWKVVRDPDHRMGPYAVKGDQWVGFDDVDTLRYKTHFVKKMGLGGAMIWALDLDDFKNVCDCESYPLLKTINRGLGRLQSQGPKCELKGSYRLQDTEDTRSIVEVSASAFGDCEDGNFRRVKGDCTAYDVCNNQQYERRTCPGGLFWNKNICDWPENTKCDDTEDMEDMEDMEKEEEDRESTRPISKGGKRVVCYFTNWAWYRNGIGEFRPEDIDPELCTHVIYGFAVLDNELLQMKVYDTWPDLDNEFFKKVTGLKKKGITVTIALGGWNDSGGDKYSRMVNNPRARQRFVRHAVDFIQQYGFQGLDLDWEYPKCWQVNCERGPASDKENFGMLVKELKEAFMPHGWILTAAVHPAKNVVDEAYDVPVLNRYLDFINVMTYDFHGHWDRATGHVAPLHDYEESPNEFFNAEFSMNYWVEKGADREKLVMGMPLYGQSFTLKQSSNTGLNAPATKGLAGEFTRSAGFLAFYEICMKVKDEGWQVVQHPKRAMGPYAFKDDQWVGYDDVDMIRRKAKFVKKNGFGGAMIWALDLDDFKGHCECEPYPLLRTINRILRDYDVPSCHSFRANLDFLDSSDISPYDIRQGFSDFPSYDKNPRNVLYTYSWPANFKAFSSGMKMDGFVKPWSRK